jgi:hypothetical protein
MENSDGINGKSHIAGTTAYDKGDATPVDSMV